MSTDIEASVGEIRGKYKKIGKAPIVIKSCDHAIFTIEKFLRKPKMIFFHGNEYGDNSIEERTIGDESK